MPEIIIKKASGERVPFDEEKLIKSLMRSQADKQIINAVVEKVKKNLRNDMSTQQIYRLAFSTLKKYSRPVASRYKLKHAIFELGPSGFPFEKFVKEIFKSLGYETTTNNFVSGKCIRHEVDVIAENASEINMAECKFHSRPGSVCEVKTSLYVSARFQDIEKTLTNNNKQFKGWLVTNTRLTADAIQFGTCAGLQLMGWDFPEGKSLKKYIDTMGLHPITSLTSLSKHEKQTLLNKGFVLCKHICDSPQILDEIKIKPENKPNIMAEVRYLCNK
jgi:ATP cone domain/Restriction endonuclease